MGGAQSKGKQTPKLTRSEKRLEKQLMDHRVKQAAAFRREEAKKQTRINNSSEFNRGILEARNEDAPLIALGKTTGFSLMLLRRLQALFDIISGAIVHDNVIDVEELSTALQLPPDSLLFLSIFKLFDVTQTRSVNFRTWVITLSAFSTHASVDTKIRFSFRLLDLNGDGQIERDEIISLLQSILQYRPPSTPRAGAGTGSNDNSPRSLLPSASSSHILPSSTSNLQQQANAAPSSAASPSKSPLSIFSRQKKNDNTTTSSSPAAASSTLSPQLRSSSLTSRNSSTGLSPLQLSSQPSLVDQLILGIDMTPQEIEEVVIRTMEAADEDGDGTISYNEYAMLMRGSTHFYESFSIDIERACSTLHNLAIHQVLILPDDESEERAQRFRSRKEQKVNPGESFKAMVQHHDLMYRQSLQHGQPSSPVLTVLPRFAPITSSSSPPHGDSMGDDSADGFHPHGRRSTGGLSVNDDILAYQQQHGNGHAQPQSIHHNATTTIVPSSNLLQMNEDDLNIGLERPNSATSPNPFTPGHDGFTPTTDNFQLGAALASSGFTEENQSPAPSHFTSLNTTQQHMVHSSSSNSTHGTHGLPHSQSSGAMLQSSSSLEPFTPQLPRSQQINPYIDDDYNYRGSTNMRGGSSHHKDNDDDDEDMGIQEIAVTTTITTSSTSTTTKTMPSSGAATVKTVNLSGTTHVTTTTTTTSSSSSSSSPPVPPPKLDKTSKQHQSAIQLGYHVVHADEDLITDSTIQPYIHPDDLVTSSIAADVVLTSAAPPKPITPSPPPPPPGSASPLVRPQSSTSVGGGNLVHSTSHTGSYRSSQLPLNTMATASPGLRPTSSNLFPRSTSTLSHFTIDEDSSHISVIPRPDIMIYTDNSVDELITVDELEQLDVEDPEEQTVIARETVAAPALAKLLASLREENPWD